MSRPRKTNKTDVRSDVRLPLDLNGMIEQEVERTGIPKAILLRSIIIGWIRTNLGASIDSASGDLHVSHRPPAADI
jgi:hypothetical protein